MSNAKKAAAFGGLKNGRFLRSWDRKIHFFEDLKIAVPGPQNRPLFSGPPFCGPGTAIFTFLKMSFLRSKDRKIGIFWFFPFCGPWSAILIFYFFVKKYYFCNSLAYFLYYIYKQKQKIQIYSKYRFCGPDFTKYTNM